VYYNVIETRGGSFVWDFVVYFGNLENFEHELFFAIHSVQGLLRHNPFKISGRAVAQCSMVYVYYYESIWSDTALRPVPIYYNRDCSPRSDHVSGDHKRKLQRPISKVADPPVCTYKNDRVGAPPLFLHLNRTPPLISGISAPSVYNVAFAHTYTHITHL